MLFNCTDEICSHFDLCRITALDLSAMFSFQHHSDGIVWHVCNLRLFLCERPAEQSENIFVPRR